MIKKIFSKIIILILLINFFPANIFAADIDIVKFYLRTSTNTPNDSIYYMNPWDKFELELWGKNTLWEDLKNVFVNLDFQNNSDFSFNWTSHRSRVQWGVTSDPLPLSSFSSSSWLNWEITNSSFPIVWSNIYPNIDPTGDYEWFEILNSAKSYVNDLKLNFTAKKVSDSSSYVWPVSQKTIYVNVNPHITEYFFSSSSLIRNWVNSVDLNVKVKDYNWCTNIDWWSVSVNLTQLWLWASEPLTYNSCDVDWKTAIFKKTWIQTTESSWDKSFDYALFSATDEDWNTVLPNDVNTSFDDEDFKTSIVLTVSEPNVPVVVISDLSDNYIWPNEVNSPNSQITFSWNQDWEYKLVANWNWTCSEWLIIKDWTSYSNWSGQTENLSSSNFSVEWSNLIYVCVRNLWWDIWSSNISITKDSSKPVVSPVTVSPVNVTSQNSSVSFSCSEDGQYKIEKISPSSYTFQNRTSANWLFVNNSTLVNSHISEWSNTIEIHCRDNAFNEWISSVVVTKQPPTPSMFWSSSSLADNDLSWDWIDWRDLSVNWDTSVWEWFSWFNSYRVYILPSWTIFDKNIHNYLTILWWDASIWSWNWNVNNLKDSAWNSFNGWSYKSYVAIMWLSWELWVPSEASWLLTYDTIVYPKILNADFISDSILEIQFNLNLKSSTWEHLSYSNDSKITYEVWWNTYTWTSVSSINWDKIQITIPSLWWTWFTWSNLNLGTWAIRADWWWYNIFTWGFLINDKILPSISWFTVDSVPNFTTWSWVDFYTWDLNFSYNLSEQVKWWISKFQFERESWNTDWLLHYAYLTWSSDLVPGAKTFIVNMDSLWLVSWSCYKVKVVWEDVSWNIWNSDYISGICYDNIWPSVSSLVPFPNNLDENDNYSANKRPILNWFSSLDNTNESWFKEYNLQVSLNSEFNPIFIDTNLTSESYTFSDDLLDGNYFWKVQWIDNNWNTWTYSLISDFIIDNSSASVTNIRFNSVTRGVDSIEFTSTWRIIDVFADVLNSSWSCIFLDLDNIWWWSWILANSFTWWVASWTWVTVWNNVEEWLKEIFISAKNSNCIWEIFSNWKNLWIDNTFPQIGTWITFPLNWNFLSWFWSNLTKIYWTAASIIENNFNYLKVDFFNWTEWLNIWNNLQNIWELSYDFPDLNISDAKIKIEVFDKSWFSTTQTWTEFILDSEIPSFSGSTVLSYPNWWEKIKWWDLINLLWSWSLITDSNLEVNPISLFYTTDWWSNFNLISEDLPNSW